MVYLSSSNPPIHEVLLPPLRGIRGDYKHPFQDMTGEPVPLDALLGVRERRVRDIQQGLDDNERGFLRPLATGTPEWTLVGILHLKQLPDILLKLHHLAQSQMRGRSPSRPTGSLRDGLGNPRR